jgi:uncharacterized protein with HEPN domain
MSKRASRLLLEDILESARKILSYTEGFSLEQFLADGKTVDAVIRNFEIIGEAASRLTEEIRNQNPDIDWNRIRGFRNRIVHDYMGIDYKIVWLVIDTFLPTLITDVRRILENAAN